MIPRLAGAVFFLAIVLPLTAPLSAISANADVDDPSAGEIYIQMLREGDASAVAQLQSVDDECLPVKYSEEHYQNLLDPSEHTLTFLAWHGADVVGGVTAHLNWDEEAEAILSATIATLGVRKAYRRRGIASALVNALLDEIQDSEPRVEGVDLHMQVGSPALAFYEKLGFEVAETIPDYYSDLEESNDALRLVLAF